MNWREQGLETRAVHAGDPHPRLRGSAVLPIFQSTVYEHTTEDASYHDVVYPRLTNLPNHVALGEKLAALEGGQAGLVTASGMAAISTILLSLLKDGGHLLIQDQLYGGTHMLVTSHFRGFGFDYDFIDPEDPASWAKLVRPDTRAVYTEALTNPTVRVIDHRQVVAFAKQHQLVSVIDNTFATPVNFRPVELGYDVVLHSATKYLNGHSDLTAGAIVGSAERIQSIKLLLDELGGTLDPHACYLLSRGLKTLPLRVRHHNASAETIAEFLASRPEVAKVNYPRLPSHPDQALAAELFAGCGGMLSFELKGGVEAATRFFDRAQIPVKGPSLGGPETLITRPATTSHAGVSPDARQRLGISDGLVRMSVGLETTEDLIADLAQAL